MYEWVYFVGGRANDVLGVSTNNIEASRETGRTPLLVLGRDVFP